jgi:hypothetical protein
MRNDTKAFIQDIILIIGIFLVGLILGIGIRVGFIDPKNSVIETRLENCITDSLNISCIEEYLIKHKVKFSRIVLAQIKLESNHLKDKRVTQDKNVTGMRVPAQRFTFAVNNHDYGAFAVYNTVEECIMDYKAWQIQNSFFITTEEDYLKMLGLVYCKDSGYVEQVKRLMK